MKRWVWLLTIYSLVLVGCTTFQGIKPISPEVSVPGALKRADSLQPTFRWEPSSEANVTYDLVVYEGITIKEESFPYSIRHAVGREVYYREGLKEPEHRIEEPLKPDTEYYWSVRLRRGAQVSSWALYDRTVFIPGISYSKVRNYPFMFKTPQK